jgi:hypothetical protein
MFLLHSLQREHDYRIDNHPYEDLAKFGYKQEMKMKMKMSKSMFLAT